MRKRLKQGGRFFPFLSYIEMKVESFHFRLWVKFSASKQRLHQFWKMQNDSNSVKATEREQNARDENCAVLILLMRCV